MGKLRSFFISKEDKHVYYSDCACALRCTVAGFWVGGAHLIHSVEFCLLYEYDEVLLGTKPSITALEKPRKTSE